MRRWTGRFGTAASALPILVVPAILPWGGWRVVAEGGALVALLFLLLRRRGEALPAPVPPGLFPFGLLLLFALAQLPPLPSFFLEIASPLTAQWYGTSIWLTDPGVSMPLSVRPKSTFLAFFALASGAALYLLAAQLFVERDRLSRGAHALCLLGLAAAVPALAILLVPAWSHLRLHLPSALFATLLPLSAGIYFVERPETTFGTLRERLSEAFLCPMAHPHLTAVSTAALSGAVLVLSGGHWLLGGVFGLLLMALLLLLREGLRSCAAPLLAAAAILLVAGVAFRGIGWKFEGLLQLPPFPMVFGAGLGAQDMVPKTEWGEGTGSGFASLAVGGGGVGVVLSGCFVLALYGKTLFAWRRRRRRAPIVFGAAALAASAVPLAVAALGTTGGDGDAYLLFFLLSGMAAAAAHPSGRGADPPRQVHSPIRRHSVTLAVMIVLGGHLLFHGGMFAAAALSAGGRTDPDSTRYDPLEEGYRIALGRAAHQSGKMESALVFYRAALGLSPLTGESLQGVATAWRALGEKERGGRLLEASLGLGSGVREGYRLHIEGLFADRRYSEGKAALKKALEMNPSETPFYRALLERHRAPGDRFEALLPETFAVLAAYGDDLRRRGKEEKAAEIYRAALARYESESSDPGRVAQIADWHLRKGDFEEALEVVEKGLRHSPADPALRRVAAECYDRSGITVRAAEERRAMKLLGGR